MLSQNAISLLRVLRRWSVGSIDKFSQEMSLPVESIERGVAELLTNQYILAEDINEHCNYQNRMLEISENGIAYLESVDGPIETFPKKNE
ncbi:hypothetical protein [Olivibacter domesticus]|uniref:Winged helix-turn-helix domain n=1 Tax=Olivibacter domesticus TaxID=407022 RepID=A0A1H7JFZ2_OLID1|nr:hypothetical protein [Olivibacter domesticus]SEK73392.1 hypothetical protein SAMN05661044_01001 [Olivibacter domesticus]